MPRKSDDTKKGKNVKEKLESLEKKEKTKAAPKKVKNVKEKLESLEKQEKIEKKVKKEKQEEIKIEPKVKESNSEFNGAVIGSSYKRRIHISYNLRLITALFILVIFALLSFYCGIRSFNLDDSKVINYNEEGKIDYKVFLKENEFYEETYLGKDMVYVASLIDNITVDFDYTFSIAKEKNITFDYKIMGNLVIKTPNGNSNYLEKEYTLLDSRSVNMEKGNIQTIHETLDIDYEYYNSLAKGFKSEFGIETNSYLSVYLQVDKKSNEEGFNLVDTTKNIINIPLSERSVEIAFNSQDMNSSKSVVVDGQVEFNTLMIALTTICIIIFLISLVTVVRLLSLLRRKENAYDMFINKVLREYDRLIVETTTGIDFDNSNIITINKFDELLDLRDNLKLPIMYYSVAAHQKCYFYIKNGTDIYMMKVKAVDLEVTARTK